MPSFRSAKAQATHAVSQKIALGRSRHEHRESGLIHSLGTARNHQQALTGFAAFLHEYKLGDLRTATATDALAYLAIRSAEVKQSTLDLDRQSLQTHLGQTLERVKSDLVTERGGRAYSPQQLAAIREHLSPRNSLSVELCERAGLRSHEVASLRPAAEQPRSTHRSWRADLEKPGHECWSVCGKGGLVRHVWLDPHLAERVRATRLEAPRVITDRGIRMVQYYRLGTGQALSQAFSRASKAALGFSTGLHGTRHTFCQRELDRLQATGCSRGAAKEIVSQLVGHFREDIVDIYLR